MRKVRNQHDATALAHAHGFGECSPAALGVVDVMDAEHRHDHIEAFVVEGEASRIGGKDLDMVTDVLKRCVREDALARVVAQVSSSPDIDTACAASRTSACGPDEQEPAARAQVKRLLITEPAWIAQEIQFAVPHAYKRRPRSNE